MGSLLKDMKLYLFDRLDGRLIQLAWNVILNPRYRMWLHQSFELKLADLFTRYSPKNYG